MPGMVAATGESVGRAMLERAEEAQDRSYEKRGAGRPVWIQPKRHVPVALNYHPTLPHRRQQRRQPGGEQRRRAISWPPPAPVEADRHRVQRERQRSEEAPRTWKEGRSSRNSTARLEPELAREPGRKNTNAYA
ncbi:Hypothetical predicted protein [Pelobates cultripes]|uniref:Uncharacterized protein n=1 Tax=Pelobates cultripes TaxID=61616 RepID=A0AAD1RHV6_PELCU|nr:Hypothetical predicted protein [Pelobates cultripes]